MRAILLSSVFKMFDPLMNKKALLILALLTLLKIFTELFPAKWSLQFLLIKFHFLHWKNCQWSTVSVFVSNKSTAYFIFSSLVLVQRLRCYINGDNLSKSSKKLWPTQNGNIIFKSLGNTNNVEQVQINQSLILQSYLMLPSFKFILFH